MAFSNTLLQEVPMGQMRFMTGTFTSAGSSTGGAVRTGLHKVLMMQLQQTGSAVVEDSPSIVTTLPAVDPITIKTTADACGMWAAWGW